MPLPNGWIVGPNVNGAETFRVAPTAGVPEAHASLAVVALALGGLFVVQLQRYTAKKPKQSQLEPLVVKEASNFLPNENRKFLTNDQYIERFEAGVFS